MVEKFDLLTTVESGGCSAKLPPAELDRLLRDLPILGSGRLLVGPETHDDASVWKIDDETALISTTDLFPPVCSDAYDFGQIAASNSFSDVYAMGGEPISALNILMFPSARIDLRVMKEILSGGVDKAIEAGCIPGASFRNLRYTESAVDFADSLDYNLKMLAADAQTSGGILMCCKAEKVDEVLDELKVSCPGAEIIGETIEQMHGDSFISLMQQS